jgi:hypothetical protein
VPQQGKQFHKPLAVPGRLHTDENRALQSPVKTLGFSRCMIQLLLLGFSRNCVYPTNLLPTGVKITSNNYHRRLLPTDSFGSPNRSLRGYERSLRSYPINPCVFQGCGGCTCIRFVPVVGIYNTPPHNPFNPLALFLT